MSVLINAKENQVLWKSKDKNYYKKHLKKHAWTKIDFDMNESSAVSKQKTANISAPYNRKRMKVKESTGMEKGKDEVYESKWYTYKPHCFTTQKGLGTQEGNNENDVINIDNAFSPPKPASKKSKPDPKLQMLKEVFGILKEKM